VEVYLCDDEWIFSEAAYAIYAPCMYMPTYEKYVDKMKQFASDKNVKVFVCDTGGKRTGMLALDGNEIVGIAVSEDLRKRGIGKHLILKVMETMRIDKIRAQTDDDAIGFYRKCGFDEEKEIIEYPDGTSVRYNCILYSDKCGDE